MRNETILLNEKRISEIIEKKLNNFPILNNYFRSEIYEEFYRLAEKIENNSLDKSQIEEKLKETLNFLNEKIFNPTWEEMMEKTTSMGYIDDRHIGGDLVLTEKVFKILKDLDPNLEKTLQNLEVEENIVELTNKYLEKEIEKEIKALKEGKLENVNILKEFYDLEDLKEIAKKDIKEILSEVEFVYPNEALNFLLKENNKGEKFIYEALQELKGINKEKIMETIGNTAYELVIKQAQKEFRDFENQIEEEIRKELYNSPELKNKKEIKNENTFSFKIRF
jgi:hypothetical protein